MGGVPGQNGWYFISPSITLSSNDSAPQLAAIYYQFVPHGAAAPTQALPGSWIAYLSPFTAPFADTDLYAFGVDIAGNMEAPISLGELKVDGMRPTTTALLSGTPGNMGWYRSTVTVTVTATDDLSGVASTRYGLDSPQMQTYSGPFTIATDGVHNLMFSSVDLAGNTEYVARVQVKVDQLAPVTTITASRGALPPGVDALSVTGTATVKSTTGGVLGSFSVQCWNTPGAVIAFSATDGSSGSGVASVTFAASGAQTIPPTTVPEASTMTLVSTAGQTTVTVAATDVAGNREATHSESVIVQAGPAGTGFACAGQTPTSFAMPAHGTLVVTGSSCCQRIELVIHENDQLLTRWSAATTTENPS